MIPAIVSIIICTRNNAASLRRTIAAVLPAIAGAPATEVVIVDNGSTDSTAAVVHDFLGSYETAQIALRSVYQPRPGKGYAYNTGLSEAAGNVLLFTDDDVIPKPGWVAGMFRLIQGGADAVAGGVVFPPELDADIPGYARQWLATTDQIDMQNPDRLVGANMAVHRHVLDRVPAFDVELGPGALGFHDETLFARQLIEAGYQITMSADAAVEHHFDRSRLTRRGLLDIAARVGRSDAYINYHWLHLDQSWSYTYRTKLMASVVASALGYQRKSSADPDAMQWQIARAKQRAYLQQYAIECRRPRNYQLRGLRKLRGPGAIFPTAVSA